MRIADTPAKPPIENILPLVNIVFLLLIFFMLAGSFNQPDFYPVDAPVANNKEQADRQYVTLVMNEKGQLAIGEQTYSDASLERYVREQLALSTDKKMNIQLKADAEVKSERVIDIMELLAAAGVDSLRLLTVAE